jgi:hypothetical protein
MNGVPIEVSDIIDLYKNHVAELTNEKIVLQAQVKALQAKLGAGEEATHDGR